MNNSAENCGDSLSKAILSFERTFSGVFCSNHHPRRPKESKPIIEEIMIGIWW